MRKKWIVNLMFSSEMLLLYCFLKTSIRVLFFSIKGGVLVYYVLMVGEDWVCAAEFQMDVSRENKSPFFLCSHHLLCSKSTPPTP